MLEHAREAVYMARGKTRADLDRSRQLNLALVRLLEVMGGQPDTRRGARSLPRDSLAEHG
jgi:hypothetical protein